MTANTDMQLVREAVVAAAVNAQNCRGAANWTEGPQVPAGGAFFMLKPVSSKFGEVFGPDGGQSVDMEAHVLVGLGQRFRDAQVLLDQYLARTGDRSLKTVLEADVTLGGLVDRIFVEGWRDYDSAVYGGVECLRAIIDLEVWLLP